MAVAMLGETLSNMFASFDAAVHGIEDVLEGLCYDYGLFNPIELILAGWSESRDQPECYVIETSDATPTGMSDDAAEAARGSAWFPEPFKLTRLPWLVNGPAAPMEVVAAAWYRGIKIDDEPAAVVMTLRKMLEMQRHSLFDDGSYWVGGFGQLTTVRPDGIVQRILQRWPEDKIGELIKPAPIDWAAWNLAHGFPPGPGTPAPRVASQEEPPLGLSKLQSDMWRRKQAKIAKRAGARQ